MTSFALTEVRGDDPERQKLHGYALDAYKSSYKDFSEQWKNAETKAQGTATISGVFLAGIFALARDVQATTPDSLKVGVTITIGALLLSVICALASLWTRKLVAAPNPRVTAHDVSQVVAVADEAEFRDGREAFWRDEARRWGLAVDSITDRYHAKATWLIAAQVTLLSGAALASLMAVVAVLDK